MAHADYHCCAICDCRMEYSHSAELKRDLCASCAVDFCLATGFKCLTAECLIDWMKRTPDAKRVLHRLGFKICHYDNDVDDEYARLADPEGVNIT